MMSVALPMIMDALIILLLAGTIFYAARLSFHIKAFRESRSEMEGLLRNLSAQIDKAEDAIEGLRQNSRQSGRDLQAVINEAHGISEELQVLSQSGDRLATRLEQARENAPRSPAYKNGNRNRSRRHEGTGPVQDTAANEITTPDYRAGAGRAAVPAMSEIIEPKRSKPFSGFAIRDKELDGTLDDAGDDIDDGFGFDDEAREDEGGMMSRAEQELFDALQARKLKAGAGGV